MWTGQKVVSKIYFLIYCRLYNIKTICAQNWLTSKPKECHHHSQWAKMYVSHHRRSLAPEIKVGYCPAYIELNHYYNYIAATMVFFNISRSHPVGCGSSLLNQYFLENYASYFSKPPFSAWPEKMFDSHIHSSIDLVVFSLKKKIKILA